jgi:hypothetical protein
VLAVILAILSAKDEMEIMVSLIFAATNKEAAAISWRISYLFFFILHEFAEVC